MSNSQSLLLLALALAPVATLTSGCSEGDGTQVSLASVASAVVSVSASHDTSSLAGSSTPSVDVIFAAPSVAGPPQPADCAVLGDDIVATFDGSSMDVISRGGYDDTGWDDASCDAFEFRLDNATPHPGADSTLVIRDASATWTIAGQDLLTDDLALLTGVAPGSTANVAWVSAPSIDSAYAQLASGPGGNDVQGLSPTTRGGAITFPVAAATPGAATLSVEAARTATPTACDGPTGGCTIGVLAGADFTVDIP